MLPGLLLSLLKLVLSSVNSSLGIQMKMIKFYEKQLKSSDKDIKKLVDNLNEYSILNSIPGIGPVYAAGILAEIGDISRFDNDAALAKYACLAWNAKQS